MKENYTYPAVFDYSAENEVIITFPSFENAKTYGSPEDDLIIIAQDYLTLLLLDFEETNKEAPSPDSPFDVPPNSKLAYINIWMPYHRSRTKEAYTKKNLTIPVWLDILAKSNSINFSAVLVKALKAELGLDLSEESV